MQSQSLTIDSKLKKSTEIESFISAVGDVSIWQTPIWTETVLKGQRNRWFVLRECDKIVATCVVIERMLFARIQFGPIYNDLKYGNFIVEQIIGYYKKKGFGFIQIQTDIGFPIEMSAKKSDVNNSWATKVIDLEDDIAQIYAEFSQNHKRSIKKIIGLNYKVELIKNDADLRKFFAIYMEMHNHRKIIPIIKEESIFIELCERLDKLKLLYLYGIYDNAGELLGGALFVKEGCRILYQIGATRRDVKLPLLHNIFNTAIKDAKSAGLKSFDLGGYAMKDGLNEQTENINRFKDGFGGELLLYPQKVQLQLNGFISRLIKFAILIREKL